MSLVHYLQKAYKEVRLTSQADLGAFEDLEGTLQPGCENLILVYGGSFNPPHEGHLDVLLSGLRPEIAAVAIVVLPSEDFHLRHKVANSHPDFFLHMQRRADIWRAIPSIPKSKIWVWTNTWYPFRPFTDAMIRLAQEDGFKLAFSHLIGPDNVNPRDPLSIYPYELPTVLVTNKARHVASQFDSDGHPSVWEGFSEWQLCTNESKHGEMRNGTSDVVLWVCAGIADGTWGKRGYYLQFAESASIDINSTKLRGELIKEHGLDETSLNQMNTETLVEMLTPILGLN